MPRCQFEAQRPTLIRNLVAEYRLATPADLHEGLAWYPLAQGIVRQWASFYRYSVDTVAAVVAAISPQCSWERNLIIADDILAGRTPSIGGALNSNIRKAERLRDTDYRSDGSSNTWIHRWMLETRMKEQFPGGPKVFHFAHNLAGNMTAVTVDTHAIQAALRDPLRTIGLSWTPYRIFAECYVAAASKVGHTPADFQAIIWHSWKRQYPRTWKQKNRQQWFAISTED